MTENNKTPMGKRVIAIIGIIALLSTYATLVVMAFLGTEMDYFMGAVAATVAIPIFTWICIWAFGNITGRHTIASLDPLTSDKEHDLKGNVVPGGKIDTVVFDIGNVLVDFAYMDFIEKKVSDKELAKRIADASVHSKEWTEYDRGVLSTEEIIAGFKKNDPEIADEIEKTFADLTDIVTKREKTIPWIKALKAAGYKVLYLSNFSWQVLEACPEAMAFIDETDGGILSYRDKVVKPDHKIYNLLAERFGLVPEKTVFIDDTKVNIDAAKELGWNGIVHTDYASTKKELEALGVTY